MDIFESLLTQSSGKQVSPELLEMLGRKASDLYRSQGIPLNQAVVQVASDHPDLGNEHIKRVVEFANNVTFQELFQNGEDKNVHFDIADPGVVLRDLKDGGTPAHDGKTLAGGMGDYKAPPTKAMASGGEDTIDHQLGELFANRNSAGLNGGENENVKMASAHVEDDGGHANPVEDVYDLQVRLQDARQRLASEHEAADLQVKEAQERLYQVIKNEVLDPHGAGLGGVIGALEKAASAELVAVVMEPAIERLSREGVPHLSQSLEKRAGAVVNPEHALIVHWNELIKTAEDQVRLASALEEVDSGLAQTKGFLAKAAGSVTSTIKGLTSPGHGKVPSALRQRFPRAT